MTFSVALQGLADAAVEQGVPANATAAVLLRTDTCCWLLSESPPAVVFKVVVDTLRFLAVKLGMDQHTVAAFLAGDVAAEVPQYTRVHAQATDPIPAAQPEFQRAYTLLHCTPTTGWRVYGVAADGATWSWRNEHHVEPATDPDGLWSLLPTPYDAAPVVLAS